ncbi:MAG: hypothetical protein J0H64_00750 [Actinobacteria bacterium]|nr:hypothetical protein [Actinomycetota bacterium]
MPLFGSGIILSECERDLSDEIGVQTLSACAECIEHGRAGNAGGGLARTVDPAAPGDAQRYLGIRGVADVEPQPLQFADEGIDRRG